MPSTDLQLSRLEVVQVHPLTATSGVGV